MEDDGDADTAVVRSLTEEQAMEAEALDAIYGEDVAPVTHRGMPGRRIRVAPLAGSEHMAAPLYLFVYWPADYPEQSPPLVKCEAAPLDDEGDGDGDGDGGRGRDDAWSTNQLTALARSLVAWAEQRLGEPVVFDCVLHLQSLMSQYRRLRVSAGLGEAPRVHTALTLSGGGGGCVGEVHSQSWQSPLASLRDEATPLLPHGKQWLHLVKAPTYDFSLAHWRKVPHQSFGLILGHCVVEQPWTPHCILERRSLSHIMGDELSDLKNRSPVLACIGGVRSTLNSSVIPTLLGNGTWSASDPRFVYLPGMNRFGASWMRASRDTGVLCFGRLLEGGGFGHDLALPLQPRGESSDQSAWDEVAQPLACGLGQEAYDLHSASDVGQDRYDRLDQLQRRCLQTVTKHPLGFVCIGGIKATEPHAVLLWQHKRGDFGGPWAIVVRSRAMDESAPEVLARSGHTTIACDFLQGDAVKPVLVVFGGLYNGHSQNDCWAVTLDRPWGHDPRPNYTYTAVPLNTLGIKPLARFRHSATIVRENMFVFGGFRNKCPLNDLHMLHLSSCRDTFTPWQGVWQRVRVGGIPPSPRGCHTAHLVDDNLWFIGGTPEPRHAGYSFSKAEVKRLGRIGEPLACLAHVTEVPMESDLVTSSMAWALLPEAQALADLCIVLDCGSTLLAHGAVVLSRWPVLQKLVEVNTSTGVRFLALPGLSPMAAQLWLMYTYMDELRVPDSLQEDQESRVSDSLGELHAFASLLNDSGFGNMVQTLAPTDASAAQHISSELLGDSETAPPLLFEPNDILSCVSKLWNDGRGSDVDIQFEDDPETLPAHRVVLSARSPFFRAMFCGTMHEASSRRIVLQLDKDAAKLCLRYLYVGKVDFVDAEGDPNAMLEALSICNVWELKALKDHLEELLTDFVDEETALYLWRLAAVNLCKRLGRAVEAYIRHVGIQSLKEGPVWDQLTEREQRHLSKLRAGKQRVNRASGEAEPLPPLLEQKAVCDMTPDQLTRLAKMKAMKDPHYFGTLSGGARAKGTRKKRNKGGWDDWT